MPDKIYKNPADLVEQEYHNLSNEAIDLFGKGQRLSPEKQQRYDQVKKQMSANAKKPLHIRSLENQTSWNPIYKKIVDSLGKLDDDVSDAYFYGLKDAHEKHNYEPTDDQIREELVDQYYRLSDSFRDSRGYGDHDWDYYGVPEFERKYGREDEFVKRLMDAYARDR